MKSGHIQIKSVAYSMKSHEGWVIATECQFFIEYPKATNLAFCPGCQRSYSIDGTATPDGVEATL